MSRAQQIIDRRPARYLLLTAIGLFLLDRAVKMLVDSGWAWPLEQSWVMIRYSAGDRLLGVLPVPSVVAVGLSLVAIGVCLATCWFLVKARQIILVVGLLAVILGGISNLVDRLVGGTVIDYIIVPSIGWSSNLADWLIVGGVVVMIVVLLRQRKENQSKQG